MSSKGDSATSLWTGRSSSPRNSLGLTEQKKKRKKMENLDFVLCVLQQYQRLGMGNLPPSSSPSPSSSSGKGKARRNSWSNASSQSLVPLPLPRPPPGCPGARSSPGPGRRRRRSRREGPLPPLEPTGSIFDEQLTERDFFFLGGGERVARGLQSLTCRCRREQRI